MLKKFALTGICVLILLTILMWGMHYGYKRGYADGSQFTNAWWIDKKGQQFETSEVIKKRLHGNHQAI
jgi:hypothetical protein